MNDCLLAGDKDFRHILRFEVMKLATIHLDNNEQAAIVTSNGVIPISNIEIEFELPGNLLDLIDSPYFEKLQSYYHSEKKDLIKSERHMIPFNEVHYAPLYRNPLKIWGIGLNYKDHASDLVAETPSKYPVGFMKPESTIIGHGDKINIPTISNKTTGEAELGIIIGKECVNIAREDWLDVVAGFTTVLDMTAEDILRENTRYLGLSKSFNTFFSFGPHLLTPDEIEDLDQLNVSTILNGEVRGTNTVSNMTFPPDLLVSFHSRIMTLKPGDIISTGTPRAAPLSHGDTLECQIDGFEPLINEIIDLKETDLI